jgi:hypothetical protein
MKVNVCKGPTWAYKQALSNKTDHDRKLELEKPSCLPRAVQNRPPLSSGRPAYSNTRTGALGVFKYRKKDLMKDF